MFIKRGTAIKLGDKEVKIQKSSPNPKSQHAKHLILENEDHITFPQVEYNPTFKLFLHTKIANPHYKPELQVGQTILSTVSGMDFITLLAER